MGFEHSPTCEKFKSEILRMLNFYDLISYFLPTCQEKLMEVLSAKSNFQSKIEYEDLASFVCSLRYLEMKSASVFLIFLKQ